MKICPVCRFEVYEAKCPCGRSYWDGDYLVMQLHFGRVVPPNRAEVENRWNAVANHPKFLKINMPDMTKRVESMIVEKFTQDRTYDHLTFVYWTRNKTMWRIDGPYPSFGGWTDVTSQDWKSVLEERLRLLEVEEIMD